LENTKIRKYQQERLIRFTNKQGLAYPKRTSMKKVTAIIEKGNDGLFSVYVAEGLESIALNGQGKTAQEAIEDMIEALDECRQVYIEDGEPVPDDIAGDIKFEYKYDVPSLFIFFDEINMTTFSRKIGINASLLRRYKNGFAFASEKQVLKIKNGLHELGRQLSSAQL
jgi:predicted RNase H-like HicB family nuclease